MNRLFLIMFSVLLFACHKSQNQIDNPEYKAIVAHSWQSDSVTSLSAGKANTVYATANNYETLAFAFLNCTFSSDSAGQVVSSIEETFSYHDQRIYFSPAAGGVGLGYSNVLQVTDSSLVLEYHPYLDTLVSVVTTYYHAQ